MNPQLPIFAELDIPSRQKLSHLKRQFAGRIELLFNTETDTLKRLRALKLILEDFAIRFKYDPD